jgi:hypothetical protein
MVVTVIARVHAPEDPDGLVRGSHASPVGVEMRLLSERLASPICRQRAAKKVASWNVPFPA